jgi:hypothetical protein
MVTIFLVRQLDQRDPIQINKIEVKYYIKNVF